MKELMPNVLSRPQLPARGASPPPILIPLVLLGAGSGLIRWFEWDLQLAEAIWNAQSGWYPSDLWWVRIFYDYGTWPALGLAIGGLLVWLSESVLRRCVADPTLTLSLALLMVLGPGLIVNTVFKEQFGRPRPREVRQFGGDQEYLPLGRPNFGADAHSFPSGHASMGFYWMGLFVFLWQKRRRSALFFGALGLVYGLWMGWVRIAVGAHWLSDVLWSAGFVYLAAWGIWYAFRHWNPREALTARIGVLNDVTS